MLPSLSSASKEGNKLRPERDAKNWPPLKLWGEGKPIILGGTTTVEFLGGVANRPTCNTGAETLFVDGGVFLPSSDDAERLAGGGFLPSSDDAERHDDGVILSLNNGETKLSLDCRIPLIGVADRPSSVVAVLKEH